MLKLPCLSLQKFLATIVMSHITISTLFPAGLEFFQDTDSFLEDLAVSEGVIGGLPLFVTLPSVLYSVLRTQNYPSLVQTKVTVSVAVSLETTSVVTV